MPAATYHWFEFTVLLRALDPDGRLFRPSVVADVHVHYVSSLLARETFRIGVAVTKIGTSSVTFGYRVEAGDGRHVAEADSVEVMVDAATRRPRALSDEARRALGH